jgi:small subunit ribosomal protein S6
MPLYETTVILRPDLSPADVQQLLDQATEIVKEGKGNVVKREYWGLRTLAYRIVKYRKAHYGFLGIDAPSAAVQELERRFRLHEDVVRLVSIVVEKIDSEPTPMMRGAGGQSDGDSDRDAA